MEPDLSGPLAMVKEAQQAIRLGNLDRSNPEIVAIFEQVKHLREADRSLRSLRRTYELDNMPSLDGEVADEDEAGPVGGDLGEVLDGYVRLRREKELLEVRLDRLAKVVEDLADTVKAQAAQIAALQPRA